MGRSNDDRWGECTSVVHPAGDFDPHTGTAGYVAMAGCPSRTALLEALAEAPGIAAQHTTSPVALGAGYDEPDGGRVTTFYDDDLDRLSTQVPPLLAAAASEPGFTAVAVEYGKASVEVTTAEPELEAGLRDAAPGLDVTVTARPARR